MVTKCVCFDIPFSTMKEVAAAHRSKTPEALQRHLHFGENCKLCRPYVEKMLETGETKFEIIG